ncbi:MAG TPA: polysaccharide deacetylase family protein [Anaerolineae bacterium]|nr:polysaccharide deacetylase family protein [Anaerolineae bacterium]
MNTHFLVQAKGLRNLARRMWSIARFYGLTPIRMSQELERLAAVLEAHGARATLPMPAVTLARQPAIAHRLQARGIELAVHGWTHVPLENRPPDEQRAHLQRARAIFSASGIQPIGFRSPYLSRDASLHAGIEATGFGYVSNQPILWDVLEPDAFPPARYAAYKRSIELYQPWRIGERPSVPRLGNNLVEIPVSLPDDEMLVDRLDASSDIIVKAWQRILTESYRRGELFTVSLHPERTAKCAAGLSATLAEARQLTPPVWFARLDEIAAWWRARSQAQVAVTESSREEFRVAASGPDEMTLLARNVEVDAPASPWADSYRRVAAKTFTVRAPVRPFVGLSPTAAPNLVDFLRQQGYIIEVSEDRQRYAYYFDQTEFPADHERRLLAQIEETDRPLVRWGRWPNSARSALTVTGDVDALTFWDYALRLIGK